jgi:EpsG family
MWPYWSMFLLPMYWALTRLRPALPLSQGRRWPQLWQLVFIWFVLMIGLRHEVGGDWLSYLEHLDIAAAETFSEAIAHGDPAYSLINWLAAQLGMGAYLVNSVCAAFFTWGLLVFCRAQPRPWLALVVAVPYLVTVVAMGYTRQGVAIGFAMLGLVALGQGRVLRFVWWIVVAATLHKSAVILVPLAVLAGAKRRVFTLLWVGLVGALLFVLMLQESVDSLASGYLEAEYQSSGAAIRIAMNALPAALFLLLRKRFPLTPQQRTFWTWMALGAIGFVVLLKLSPSSTAVDRVALYWIPLQLFVWSRLPNALGRPNGKNPVWVFAVVAYSAAVLLVWLAFADTAFAWLPYQFYPWIWLWK